MSDTAPQLRILVLVGSLRTASINRQIAHLAVANAPDRVRLEIFDRIGELPHYNEDIDTDSPAVPVAALRDAAAAADGLLAVTPEYNGGIPGVLKNTIDWLSRPYGNSPLKGKPAAVIGASLGQYGGTWAHQDARKALGIAGLRVIEDIVMSVPTKSLVDGQLAGGDGLVGRLRESIAQLAGEVIR